MYTIEELVRAAQVQFGLSPVLVEAALRATGKTEFTLEDARRITEQFALKVVEK